MIKVVLYFDKIYSYHCFHGVFFFQMGKFLNENIVIKIRRNLSKKMLENLKFQNGLKKNHNINNYRYLANISSVQGISFQLK